MTFEEEGEEIAFVLLGLLSLYICLLPLPMKP